MNKKTLAGGTISLAATASVFAQQQPFMLGGTGQPALLPAAPEISTPANRSAATNAVAAPAPNPVETFFNGKIPGALADGKLNLNVRLRLPVARDLVSRLRRFADFRECWKEST
jgi:hypothetical protein